jgi:hypothetical protein
MQGRIGGEIPAGVNRDVDGGKEEENPVGPGKVGELAGQVADTRPASEEKQNNKDTCSRAAGFTRSVYPLRWG